MYDELLRMRELRAIVGGVSKQTVYAWIRDYGFPRPIKLAPNVSAWRRRAVREWIAQRERMSA